jgi:hypothetical protein
MSTEARYHLRTVMNGAIRLNGDTYAAASLDDWHRAQVIVVTVPNASDRVRVYQNGGPEICTAHRLQVVAPEDTDNACGIVTRDGDTYASGWHARAKGKEERREQQVRLGKGGAA